MSTVGPMWIGPVRYADPPIRDGKEWGRVDPRSKRWITVSDSPHDHEREALAFLRRMLPDSDPIRVWSNFEFIADTGAVYEVDALAITANGVYLIEIKSHPGEISGDATTWKWTRPDSSFTTFDNPLLLANRKAKHLATLLDRTQEYRKAKTQSPFVRALVFLSDPDLRVSLAPQARSSVFGRDPEDPSEEIPRQRRSIGGIVHALTTMDPGSDGRPIRRIDRPTSERLARALDEVGIRERTGRRRVGEYQLGDLLDDVESDADTGVTYQDFAATHTSIGVKRRIRIYPIEHNATQETREVASRAAKREFQLLEALDHPGILRPVDYVEAERGPALIFDFDADEVPLHRWLERPDVKDFLTTSDRLAVTRMIAEAVHSAHQKGVTHRALSPSSVLVRGGPDAPSIRITNWHAGARIASGSSSTGGTTGTIHVEALDTHDVAFYRAPEFGQPNVRPILLDTFSVGALATLVFTDHAPAETLSAYTELLVEARCIPADMVGDGLDPDVVAVIAEATATDPRDRFESLADLLAGLELIEEEWAKSDRPAEPPPEAAIKGDTLGDGRFEVEGRLGRGSTAFALKVKDLANNGRPGVLKIAVDAEHNPRIEAEAAAISQLVHRNIVRLLDGPIVIGGRAALLLTFAGSTTLAARLADRPLAELSERFGEDLLEAIRHLEQTGVSHRDVKPENIGVTEMGANDELHLMLFDFSLASAPLDQIAAGTQGYIDPFLKLKGRQAWDLHAERYSAAVTLFELLTGTRPVYGDGSADPAMTDDPPTIDRSMFEPAIAPGLVDFFTTALARDVDDRFDTANEMLAAWKRAFEPASRPATGEQTDDTDDGEPFELILPPGIASTTPLAGLPLSNRAVNALERQEVLTVGDLLDFPLNRLPQIRGVGSKTRREIGAAAGALREVMATDDQEDVDVDSLSLVEIAEALIPKTRRADQESQTKVLRALAGLDGSPTDWPTQRQLAETFELTQGRISQLIASGRSRWVRQPAISQIRNWIADELQRVGGIATIRQLRDRLLASRPVSGSDTETATRAAGAAIRAALTAEEERDTRRWAIRRRGPGVVVAAETTEPGAPTGEQLADYASAAASAVEQLLEAHTVATRSELLQALASVDPPLGARPVPDSHLAELATELAPNAAVNSRLELYRAGMPPADALQASRRVFVAVRAATPAEIADKVRSRFPEAAALPGRPELDSLLADAGIVLQWDSTEGRYAAPKSDEPPSSSATTFRRHPTGVPTEIPPVEIDRAADFDARLKSSIDSGGLLVLLADPTRLDDAARQLEELPVTMLDFDQLVFDKLAGITATGKPSWELITEADAQGPGTAAWTNLTKVIDRALDAITTDLFKHNGTIAIHRLGLLSRYNRLTIASQWRDRLHDNAATLKGIWLLAGSPQTSPHPVVDSKPVPVLGTYEWVRIPREWLENAHRAGVSS